MKEYIDEMLHLTADIAEELLAIKDTDSDVNEELCRKIRRLSFIADANVTPLQPDEKIEAITDSIIRDSATEMMQDAESEPSSRDSETESETESETGTETETETETDTYAETEVENETSEALIDEARREAQLSEEPDEGSVLPQTPETEPQHELHENHSEEDVEPCRDMEEEAPSPEADCLPAAEETEATEDVKPSEMSEKSSLTEPCSYQAKEPVATDAEAEAESATFEESADADISDNETPAPMVTATRLRNAFTLNDMFLFRRVLFGGSAKRFNDALEHISTLRSVDEIKDYLSESLHINPRSEEAKDFVGCISPFFGY